MFKKIFSILVCLVFLLSMSTIVAEGNISGNFSSAIEDLDEFDVDNFDESLDEEGIIVDEYDEICNDSQTLDFESLEVNTTGVVMSDDDYSCGAASFATVLNNMGINITLDEARTVVNTTINGTTMEGIINGANKYNLTAYGINANINCLNENFIVHMSIYGTDHWSVVKQISEDYIILADSNLGIVNYTKECFAELYTNNSIVISKSYIDTKKLEENKITILNVDKTKKISGKKVKTKKVPKKAYKQYRYNLNKKRNQYRWVYPTDIYEYKHISFLRGYCVYYYWAYVSTKNKYSKWYNC